MDTEAGGAPSEGFALLEFLDKVTALPGTTDVTLVSDGRVAVRRNTRLTVTRVDSVKAHWAQGVAVHFSEAGCRPGEARTAVLRGGARRYRATLVPQSGGASLCVRPLADRIRDAEELRLPEGLKDYFLGLRGGLVLVGGATGSGKSTTVASLLDSRREAGGGKIVTLEDPIELLHCDDDRTIFSQRELGVTVGSYAQGLREALQMNPDVIAVQEIRESEAAETALGGALSGHLVVASIHAFTAATAPQRYLSVLNPALEDFGARDALASCLEAVVIQRLLPGYEDLVPVFEVMVFRHKGERLPAMERLVRQGNWVGLRQEMESGRRLGMLLAEDCLRQRISEGLLPPLS